MSQPDLSALLGAASALAPEAKLQLMQQLQAQLGLAPAMPSAIGGAAPAPAHSPAPFGNDNGEVPSDTAATTTTTTTTTVPHTKHHHTMPHLSSTSSKRASGGGTGCGGGGFNHHASVGAAAFDHSPLASGMEVPPFSPSSPMEGLSPGSTLHRASAFNSLRGAAAGGGSLTSSLDSRQYLGSPYGGSSLHSTMTSSTGSAWLGTAKSASSHGHMAGLVSSGLINSGSSVGLGGDSSSRGRRRSQGSVRQGRTRGSTGAPRDDSDSDSDRDGDDVERSVIDQDDVRFGLLSMRGDTPVAGAGDTPRAGEQEHEGAAAASHSPAGGRLPHTRTGTLIQGAPGGPALVAAAAAAAYSPDSQSSHRRRRSSSGADRSSRRSSLSVASQPGAAAAASNAHVGAAPVPAAAAAFQRPHGSSRSSASNGTHASLHSSDFVLGDLLGTGLLGKVYRGQNRTTGEQVAVKVYVFEGVHSAGFSNSSGSNNDGGGNAGGSEGDNDPAAPVDAREAVRREVTQWSALTAGLPNLLPVYGAAAHGPQQLWVVSQLQAWGSCADLLARRRKAGLLPAAPAPAPAGTNFMPESLVSFVLRGALLGLQQLYSCYSSPPLDPSQPLPGHGSIKASSLLVSSAGMVRLSDRAAAQRLDATFRPNAMMSQVFWMAPEAIAEAKPAPRPQDVWQLGVMAIELSEGAPPHAGMLPLRVTSLIPMGPPPKLRQAARASDAFNDFVKLCCAKQPAQRPSVEQLLAHPFIVAAEQIDPAEMVEFAKAY